MKAPFSSPKKDCKLKLENLNFLELKKDYYKIHPFLENAKINSAKRQKLSVFSMSKNLRWGYPWEYFWSLASQIFFNFFAGSYRIVLMEGDIVPPFLRKKSGWVMISPMFLWIFIINSYFVLYFLAKPHVYWKVLYLNSLNNAFWQSDWRFLFLSVMFNRRNSWIIMISVWRKKIE